MTSPHTGQTPSITYYPFSTQPLRTMQTQGQVAAYRRLAIAILGLDVATAHASSARAEVKVSTRRKLPE